MLNDNLIIPPLLYNELVLAGEQINFNMPSDLKTGSLIRTLAASKPGGRFLDIGTGTGLSLAWMADGSDNNATITTIDNNDVYQSIAKQAFINDKRITFICDDGNNWLTAYKGDKFDLIFADAMPGKFENLDIALNLVKPGGFYLIDDLLPQPNWGEDHPPKVKKLLETLQQKKDFVSTTFNWSTGLILFTKTS